MSRRTLPSLALSLALAGVLGAQEPAPPAELPPSTAELERLDLEPVRGGLLAERVDVAVGAGPARVGIRRTLRPWQGDLRDTGPHWTSILDARLTLDRQGRPTEVHDDRGRTLPLEPCGQDQLRCALGGLSLRLRRAGEEWLLDGLEPGRTWAFGTAGELRAIRAPGVELRFERAADGRVRAIHGPWGALRCERDARGVLSAVRTPAGRVVRYERHATSGHLVRVSDGRVQAEYGHDERGRPTTFGGDLARVRYDPLGRVVAIDGPATRPVRAQYVARPDGLPGWRTVVERAGERTSYDLDQALRAVRVTDPRGQTTLVTLDAAARPTRVESPAGASALRWDEEGRLVEVAGAEGALRVTHGPQGPTTVTLGATVLRRTFDAEGRLLREELPGDAAHYARDAAGRVESITDARGQTVRIERDAQGQPVTLTRAGGATRVAWDQDGRPQRVTHADGTHTVVTHGADGGLLLSQTGPEGVRRLVQQDAQGRVVETRDGVGRVDRFQRDARGDLLRLERGGELLLELTRDAAGRPCAVRDGVGNVSSWSRTPRGWRGVDAASGPWSVTTDAAGRPLELTRAGRAARFTWNELGQLVGRAGPAGAERFVRDAQGRLVREEGPHGALERGYDAQGRVVWERDVALQQELRWEYDAAGRRRALRAPWGAVGWERDARGRVCAVVLPSDQQGEQRITLELLPDGRRAAVSFPNGVVTRYRWEGRRLLEVRTERQGTLLDRRAYGYETGRRVAWVEDATGRRTSYGYDAQGRLTLVEGPEGARRYSYDAAGNRHEEGLVVQVGPGNQLLRRGAEELAWDQAGALASWTAPDAAPRALRHDMQGRLEQVTLGPAEAQRVRYGHAPDGTLLWREEGDRRTRYLHDGYHRVAEVGPDGAVVAAYAFGPELDDLLALRREGRWYFVHRDLLGSVTALTDAQGQVAARYAYGPFGEQLAAEGPAAAGNPFRFQGRPLDPATGLYDFRARAYAPELGRFTAPDPLGYAAGPNRYAFVSNLPTSLRDPLGLSERIGPELLLQEAERAGLSEAATEQLLSDFGYEVNVERYTIEELIDMAAAEDPAFLRELATDLGLNVAPNVPTGVLTAAIKESVRGAGGAGLSTVVSITTGGTDPTDGSALATTFLGGALGYVTTGVVVNAAAGATGAALFGGLTLAGATGAGLIAVGIGVAVWVGYEIFTDPDYDLQPGDLIVSRGPDGRPQYRSYLFPGEVFDSLEALEARFDQYRVPNESWERLGDWQQLGLWIDRERGVWGLSRIPELNGPFVIDPEHGTGIDFDQIISGRWEIGGLHLGVGVLVAFDDNPYGLPENSQFDLYDLRSILRYGPTRPYSGPDPNYEREAGRQQAWLDAGLQVHADGSITFGGRRYESLDAFLDSVPFLGWAPDDGLFRSGDDVWFNGVPLHVDTLERLYEQMRAEARAAELVAQDLGLDISGRAQEGYTVNLLPSERFLQLAPLRGAVRLALDYASRPVFSAYDDIAGPPYVPPEYAGVTPEQRTEADGSVVLHYPGQPRVRSELNVPLRIPRRDAFSHYATPLMGERRFQSTINDLFRAVGNELAKLEITREPALRFQREGGGDGVLPVMSFLGAAPADPSASGVWSTPLRAGEFRGALPDLLQALGRELGLSAPVPEALPELIRALAARWGAHEVAAPIVIGPEPVTFWEADGVSGTFGSLADAIVAVRRRLSALGGRLEDGRFVIPGLAGGPQGSFATAAEAIAAAQANAARRRELSAQVQAQHVGVPGVGEAWVSPFVQGGYASQDELLAAIQRAYGSFEALPATPPSPPPAGR